MAEETMKRLLAKGLICAADLRCLDCRSKQCMWRLCLTCCAGKMGICRNREDGQPPFSLAADRPEIEDPEEAFIDRPREIA
jgi:hypothetical protein